MILEQRITEHSNDRATGKCFKHDTEVPTTIERTDGRYRNVEFLFLTRHH